MHRGFALILALALIVGPIVAGVLLFRREAPAQRPGGYVQTVEGIYGPWSCVSGSPPEADVASTAAVAHGGVLSFFLVLPDSLPAAATAPSARLYFRVVNHAEPRAVYARTPLKTIVTRMNPRVYRVTSDQTLRWDTRQLPGSVYRQALSHAPGNRATMELLLELEVPAPPAGPCRYAVTLGPPPTLPDIDVKWFVPATESRP